MKQMNQLNPLPITYNATRLHLNTLLNASIPQHTVDLTAEQFFDRPFTTMDVEWAKDHIKKHSGKSAAGIEGISYQDVQAVDNDLLVGLLNTCLCNNDAPSIWFTTVLTGALKKGKPASDPNSYQTIGLESCVLKVITLLIHYHFSQWASAQSLIPHSQNGFRETYCTNNNAFVLQCAIERAHSLGKTLYVASVDITNAFPSAEHATLWIKLQHLGAGGKISDWIQMLYQQMSYIV